MSEAITQLEKKDESKPWKNVCVKRCWYAKGSVCHCRCKKENHGKGIIKRLTDMEKEKDEKDSTRDSRGSA